MNKEDIEAALDGLFYEDGTFRFKDIYLHQKTIQLSLRLAHKVMSEPSDEQWLDC